MKTSLDKKNLGLKGLAYLVVASFLTIPSLVWSGYVLVILWGWFITPAFGLPVPSIAMALGISVVISYLTHQHPYIPDDRDLDSIFWWSIGKSFFTPAGSLLLGYIIHCYV